MGCRFAACSCHAPSTCLGVLKPEMQVPSSSPARFGGVFSPGKVRGYGTVVGLFSDYCEWGRRSAYPKREIGWALNRRQMLLGSILISPLRLTKDDVALAGETQDIESSSPSETQESAEIDTFGFDGLGSKEDEYAVGKVVALAQAGDGAVLFLGVDGFDLPLQLVIGAAEAMAILTAAQERRSRRPATHEAWSSSLAAVGWKVDHVTITTKESDVFYCRLVLSLGKSLGEAAASASGSDRLRSVDMRPSDAIALALRCRAPLFINKKVAEEAVSALIKGSDPAKKPSDALNRPGLQVKSATDTLSSKSMPNLAWQLESGREPLWGYSDDVLLSYTVYNS
ncbi:uncharacterized protein [Physcomitrium patens]|uniref:BFN domain-containing protein n=1 Tax=Physcomitrium patens TaxID=3218 RepID=A0A2K1JVA5_PHYPA|nr:uncharacterized protein LOC112288945 isoform X2 [Physcomitrium patens]XP_024389489.1 uncharacterized protein LOC112288945 isoform X2 [Physcomitrium patens]PNR45451.1 hypothetical protein PHYPA_015222 [Physcomitrium patens]|eukprot:XP_024389488.1 uncharacterized protein LOC112288945 isoform X2 [Physcomitrella patens]